MRLGANELQLLAYLYEHRGTDIGECDDTNPVRVMHDLKLSARRFRESAECCEQLGLLHVDGLPIAPHAERIANLKLTIKGRELLWLLENALAPTKIASNTCWQDVMGEIDVLLEQFLSR